MAALSLTEIRDAFAEEEDGIDAKGFGADTIPMQQLPDHQKKTSLVGPRLVNDHESTMTEKRAKKARRRKESMQRNKEKRQSSKACGDMKKLTMQALAITSGIAIHHAISQALALYFEKQYVTTWNRICIVFIYPVCIVLVLWTLKHSSIR